MVDTQHFCLRWNNYQSSITSAFENLRDDEDFVDVTLACDGKSLKAHRVVLSACSPYFRELLKVRHRHRISSCVPRFCADPSCESTFFIVTVPAMYRVQRQCVTIARKCLFFSSLLALLQSTPCKHPVIVLQDVAFSDLHALVEFIYHGEVNVHQRSLSSFLKTAEVLRVSGLTQQADQTDRDEVSIPPIVSLAIFFSSVRGTHSNPSAICNIRVISSLGTSQIDYALNVISDRDVTFN